MGIQWECQCSVHSGTCCPRCMPCFRKVCRLPSHRLVGSPKMTLCMSRGYRTPWRLDDTRRHSDGRRNPCNTLQPDTNNHQNQIRTHRSHLVDKHPRIRCRFLQGHIAQCFAGRLRSICGTWWGTADSIQNKCRGRHSHRSWPNCIRTQEAGKRQHRSSARHCSDLRCHTDQKLCGTRECLA